MSARAQSSRVLCDSDVLNEPVRQPIDSSLNSSHEPDVHNTAVFDFVCSDVDTPEKPKQGRKKSSKPGAASKSRQRSAAKVHVNQESLCDDVIGGNETKRSSTVSVTRDNTQEIKRPTKSLVMSKIPARVTPSKENFEPCEHDTVSGGVCAAAVPDAVAHSKQSLVTETLAKFKRTNKASKSVSQTKVADMTERPERLTRSKTKQEGQRDSDSDASYVDVSINLSVCQPVSDVSVSDHDASRHLLTGVMDDEDDDVIIPRDLRRNSLSLSNTCGEISDEASNFLSVPSEEPTFDVEIMRTKDESLTEMTTSPLRVDDISRDAMGRSSSEADQFDWGDIELGRTNSDDDGDIAASSLRKVQRRHKTSHRSSSENVVEMPRKARLKSKSQAAVSKVFSEDAAPCDSPLRTPLALFNSGYFSLLVPCSFV